MRSSRHFTTLLRMVGAASTFHNLAQGYLFIVRNGQLQVSFSTVMCAMQPCDQGNLRKHLAGVVAHEDVGAAAAGAGAGQVRRCAFLGPSLEGASAQVRVFGPSRLQDNWQMAWQMAEQFT